MERQSPDLLFWLFVFSHKNTAGKAASPKPCQVYSGAGHPHPLTGYSAVGWLPPAVTLFPKKRQQKAKRQKKHDIQSVTNRIHRVGGKWNQVDFIHSQFKSVLFDMIDRPGTGEMKDAVQIKSKYKQTQAVPNRCFWAQPFL